MREVFVEVPDVALGRRRRPRRGQARRCVEARRVAAALPRRSRDGSTSRPPKGVLLTGPPGTGKTLLAQGAGHRGQANFIAVKGPELLSKWVGEMRARRARGLQQGPAGRALRPLLRRARRPRARTRGHVARRRHRPRDRPAPRPRWTASRGCSGVVVVGATNRPDLLDPAVLRPGRFDLVLELPLPDREARRMIFAIHTRKRALAANASTRLRSRSAPRVERRRHRGHLPPVHRPRHSRGNHRRPHRRNRRPPRRPAPRRQSSPNNSATTTSMTAPTPRLLSSRSGACVVGLSPKPPPASPPVPPR